MEPPPTMRGWPAPAVPQLTRFNDDPSVQHPIRCELIAEYATIEDRLRALEARVYGGCAPPVNPEMVRLTERERQVLALLRRHRFDQRTGGHQKQAQAAEAPD